MLISLGQPGEGNFVREPGKAEIRGWDIHIEDWNELLPCVACFMVVPWTARGNTGSSSSNPLPVLVLLSGSAVM